MVELTEYKLSNIIALNKRQPKIFIINKQNNNALFINNNHRTIVFKDNGNNITDFIILALKRNNTKFIDVSDFKRKTIIYAE